MVDESQIFHESWYRIADQRVSLRASVKVRRQLFRGNRWYVLNDPFNDQYFRLRPSAYQFVARLSMTKTVEQVWKEVIEHNPDEAPGQEEVIHLLAQLYHANLLHYDLPPDSEKLFDRYKEQKQKVVKSTLMNIMFFRVPLFDPDAFLKRILPIIKLIFSPLGIAIWIAVVAGGIKIAVDNFSALGSQSQGILSPTNIPLLYLSLILIKACHEFGHSFMVRRFGGEVHTMGVMFLIFNPLPYMDATSAWAFRSKWKRVLVGAAGMIVEVFFAAIAAFVWANTAPGVINSLAYNMMFIASVSTILFNINPLLRFDGYYILSDLLDIPNLHTQASQQLQHLVERYAFGYRKSKSPAATSKEAFWLTVFGILSGIYRVVVFTSILLFVADRFLIAGIIMAVICVVAWVLVPLGKLVKYLATSPKLDRIRLRATAVTSAAILAVVSLFYFIPFPNSFRAPGVLEAEEYAVTITKVGGYVEEILAPSGTRVEKGQPLVRLRNEELDFLQAESRAQAQEVQAMYQRALIQSQADVAPIQSLIQSVRARLERLEQEEEDLVVAASISGIWVAPRLDEYVGMWVHRGTAIGQLVNDEGFDFVSVVSQQDTSWVFSNEILDSQVKLAGQAEVGLAVQNYQRIPVEQTSLPSAALGLGAGGDVAIDVTDQSGLSTAEPYYQVRLGVQEPEERTAAMLHGRSGMVRFVLPNEPLLHQWWRKLRQLLQERYQL
jgi:putative peptide zinc metalloprotease protein